MSHFTNLGDLIRRERDLDKIALIDLGGEQQSPAAILSKKSPASSSKRERISSHMVVRASPRAW